MNSERPQRPESHPRQSGSSVCFRALVSSAAIVLYSIVQLIRFGNRLDYIYLLIGSLLSGIYFLSLLLKNSETENHATERPFRRTVLDIIPWALGAYVFFVLGIWSLKTLVYEPSGFVILKSLVFMFLGYSIVSNLNILNEIGPEPQRRISRAPRHFDATFYQMANPYLDEEQKMEVRIVVSPSVTSYSICFSSYSNVFYLQSVAVERNNIYSSCCEYCCDRDELAVL